MIKIMPDSTRHDYVKRVNPGIPIPVNVIRIIGITDDDLKDAPSFKDIAKEVLDFIGDSDLGGFNIQRFDIPVLEREFLKRDIASTGKSVISMTRKRYIIFMKKRPHGSLSIIL